MKKIILNLWQRYFGWILAFLFIVLILLGIASFNVLAESEEAETKVSFLDVGQGDSILIESGRDKQVLIDGGPGSRVLEKLGKIMPFWDHTIEVVILTHPDADHIRGLIDVLKRYEVKRVIEFKVDVKKALYEEWKRVIAEKEIEVLELKNGDFISLTPKTKLEIIFPYSDDLGKTTKNLNDSSIVCLLDTGEIEFLFTGDAEKSEIRKIISREGNIEAEILKVGHHGSRNATTKELLEYVRPEIAVISVGAKNSYGHPHKEVLDLLDLFEIKIYRTDKQGTIKVITNGRDWRVETEK